MDLSFIEEEIPKITRAGGSGREAEPWEEHVSPLKAEDKAGKSYRVWTYGKRPSAVSRMSSVRERLTKAVPAENWQLAVRAVPGTESAVHPAGTMDGETDVSGTSATQYGVYVQYAGQFTAEQVAENAQKHQERSERVKAARAKAAENTPDVQADDAMTEATDADPSEASTAKAKAAERVAQARAKANA